MEDETLDTAQGSVCGFAYTGPTTPCVEPSYSGAAYSIKNQPTIGQVVNYQEQEDKREERYFFRNMLEHQIQAGYNVDEAIAAATKAVQAYRNI